MNAKEQFPDPSQPSRRKFLAVAGKALAASLLLSQKSDTYIPPKDYGLEAKKKLEATVRPSAEIRIGRTESEDDVQITPEYQRHLERLLMIVPPNFRYKSSGGRNGPAEYLQQNADFFASLPEYTKLDLVTDSDGEPALREAIGKMGIKTDIRIHPMWADNIYNLDEWSQDVGEICRINGKEVFILPKAKSSSWTRGRELAWKKMSQIYFKAENVVEADFYFQGGNMTFDISGGGVEGTCRF